MAEQVTLLVVDDDARLRELLKEFLNRNGFSVVLAEDTLVAQQLCDEREFDAIVLDIMLPGRTGIAWTQALRQQGVMTPIILLTARWLPGDRVSGLEAGANDYLPKPFEPKELVLRLRNLLKGHFDRRDPRFLQLGDRTIDLNKGIVVQEGEEIPLSSTELNLLKALSARKREPLSREELGQLSGAHISDRSVDVQIRRLRQKIETDPSQPHFLKTSRHKGYSLWTDTEE
jgi:two-component system phosphate regulon response regulator OmpR